MCEGERETEREEELNCVRLKKRETEFVCERCRRKCLIVQECVCVCVCERERERERETEREKERSIFKSVLCTMIEKSKQEGRPN